MKTPAETLVCTSIKCTHGKIPYGGHCAWDWCPNYRRNCPVHISWPPKVSSSDSP